MDKATQKILNDITEIGSIIGMDVIMDYVNRQNAACNEESMSSVAGKLEEVTEDGVKVSQDYAPFAGPLAAICSIKQIGNNKLVYENLSAQKTYTKGDFSPLSNEQMTIVKQQGRWIR